VGSDSLQSWFMRLIHIGDPLVPVDPDGFGARLESAGFEVVEIEKKARGVRFMRGSRHRAIEHDVMHDIRFRRIRS